MGIYKVIKIKLPKILQGNKKRNIIAGFVSKRPKKTKNIVKRRNKNIKKCYHSHTTPYKKHKKQKPHTKIKLKYVLIVLFFVLVLIKGITILHYHNEQKQIQNTEAVTETKRNFFVKESLPY